MEILGHQPIWQFLKNSAQSGKLPHAYLFSGPEKLGKKTLAIRFIKLLNCQNKNFKNKPCDECRNCREIDLKSFPDFFFVEVKPGKKEIELEQIKNLKWYLSLQAYNSDFKSAVIDNAHLMNKDSQNCLLKTLEEPRGRTIIFLITDLPELLFPTIISRTSKLRFSTVPDKETRLFLKNKKLSEEKIENLISISRGRPGSLIDFLNEPGKVKERQKRIEDLKKLIESPLCSRFEYAKNIISNSESVKEILDIWSEYFREKFSLEIGKPDEKKQFFKYKKIIDLIQKTNFLISKTDINPELALENLLLEL